MSRPWMPLYVADYLADTGHLSAAEHGAYLLLIMHYWQRGALPTDERQLARIARLDGEEWASARPTLSSFFGEGWRHERIEGELSEAREKYERRAAAGRTGGKAKAKGKQCSSNATSESEALLNQPQPQPPLTVASATDAAPPVNPRDELWREGVSTLKAMTGATDKAARSLIGKWLSTAKDDCSVVLGKIRTARDERMVEPVAWITAALKPPDPPPKKLTQGESLRNMGRAAGVIDDTGSPPRRLETSHRDRENPGVGELIRLAVSGNDGW